VIFRRGARPYRQNEPGVGLPGGRAVARATGIASDWAGESGALVSPERPGSVTSALLRGMETHSGSPAGGDLRAVNFRDGGSQPLASKLTFRRGVERARSLGNQAAFPPCNASSLST